MSSASLCDLLRQAGVSLCGDINVRTRLDALRKLYEPHACAMAHYLRLELPHWTPPPVECGEARHLDVDRAASQPQWHRQPPDRGQPAGDGVESRRRAGLPLKLRQDQMS